MNVQFAVKDGEVYLIEVNPRASRTVPFVAKAIGTPIAKIAARVMAGEPLAGLGEIARDIDYIAVKEAVFPFARFPGTDPVLGPEMKSTGEVMGIDRDFDIAFAKSLLGAGMILPQRGTVFVSVKDGDKDNIVPAVAKLVELGFTIIATGGTARYLQSKGLPVETRQQGGARPAAYRRPADRRRGRPGLQHDRGLAVAEGQPFDPRDGARTRRSRISPRPLRAWPRRGRSRRSGPCA